MQSAGKYKKTNKYIVWEQSSKESLKLLEFVATKTHLQILRTKLVILWKSIRSD